MTRGIIDGDVRMARDGDVSGIGGSVTVAAGCRVAVSGIVQGDVIAEPGARVLVSGIVSGQVRALGDAAVEVTGMVG